MPAERSKPILFLKPGHAEWIEGTLPQIITMNPTDEQIARAEAIYQSVKATIQAGINVAVTEESLPAGVLARMYRAGALADKPTILINREYISLSALMAAQLVLAREIADRLDDSDTTVLTLTTDYLASRPDGSKRSLEMLGYSAPPDVQAADAKADENMHANLSRTPVARLDGYTVRIMDFYKLRG